MYNQLERLKNMDVTPDVLFFKHKSTGDLIPVAEIISEDAERIAKKIRSGRRGGLTFISLHQDCIIDVLKSVSGSSVKILMYIASKTKFENYAFGITYRDLASDLGMSVKTVTLSMKELKDYGAIVISGKRGKYVYHVNPALFWKGHISQAKERLTEFEEKMDIKTIKDEL
jgi:DNA-binding transcriptional regulator YhcF (GntR family)